MIELCYCPLCHLWKPSEYVCQSSTIWIANYGMQLELRYCDDCAPAMDSPESWEFVFGKFLEVIKAESEQPT